MINGSQNNPELEERCAPSIGGSETIIKYIPDLLEGLWDLGTDSSLVVQMIKGLDNGNYSTCIDLGCGKGAVAIKAAKEFGWKVRGVDGLKCFIDYAKLKAEEYEVKGLVEFVQRDILEELRTGSKFDVVIMGAVGNLLGGLTETVKRLSEIMNEGGLIIIDDCVAPEEGNDPTLNYPKFSEASAELAKNGFEAAAYHLLRGEEQERFNQAIYSVINANCQNLTKLYPADAHLFSAYLEAQQKENSDLSRLEGIIWILRRKAHLI